MQDFFDRFKPKKKDESDKKSSSSSNNNNNTNNNKGLGNLLGGMGIGGPKSFSGEGKSLGGTKKPGKVISILLPEPGPLGIQVEKRPGTGTSIVAMVVPGSQAEKAGIIRGDVLCFAGSNGQEEILHSMFIELAKSNQRPISLEIRRIEIKSNNTGTSTMSAEAFTRKQAMIAAAEERERKHKIATKPVKTGFVPKSTSIQQQQQQQLDIQSSSSLSTTTTIEPVSEASRQAIEIAKAAERRTAAELGYNPYEVNKATAGQARNAVTTVTHGTLQNNTTTDTTSTSSSGMTLPTISPPVDPTTTTTTTNSSTVSLSEPPPPEFDEIFESIVISNSDYAAVRNSLTIACKLISNATTNDDIKFKKVRLANPKIKAAIVDVHGTLDIMLLVGFELSTDPDTSESILVYPYEQDQQPYPWIPQALDRLQAYCKDDEKSYTC